MAVPVLTDAEMHAHVPSPIKYVKKIIVLIMSFLKKIYRIVYRNNGMVLISDLLSIK